MRFAQTRQISEILIVANLALAREVKERFLDLVGQVFFIWAWENVFCGFIGLRKMAFPRPAR